MIVSANVYAHNGEATLDSAGGKNELIVLSGSLVEEDVAKEMGLPALFEQYDKKKVEEAHRQNDPLARLKATKKPAPKMEAKP